MAKTDLAPSLFVLCIICWFILRELKLRWRLRCEKYLLRQQQAMREEELRRAEAEDDGAVLIYVFEERIRMELTENVINMTREHPKDVARLIRLWLREGGLIHG